MLQKDGCSGYGMGLHLLLRVSFSSYGDGFELAVMKKRIEKTKSNDCLT